MNIEDIIKENNELLNKIQSENQPQSMDIQLTQMREQLNYLQQIDIKRQARYDQLVNQSSKLQQLFIELMNFVNDSQIRGNQFNTIIHLLQQMKSHLVNQVLLQKNKIIIWQLIINFELHSIIIILTIYKKIIFQNQYLEYLYQELLAILLIIMKISKMNLMNNFHPKMQIIKNYIKYQKYLLNQIFLMLKYTYKIKYHPDKLGGDSSNFQLIQKANEVLSYPEKKKIYDKFGKQRITQIIQYQESIIQKFEPHNLGHKIALKDVALEAYHKNPQMISKDHVKNVNVKEANNLFKGNSKLDYENGDIQIYLEIEQHKIFIRKGMIYFINIQYLQKKPQLVLIYNQKLWMRKLLKLQQKKQSNKIQYQQQKRKVYLYLKMSFILVTYMFNFTFRFLKNYIKMLLRNQPKTMFQTQNSINLQEFKFDDFEKHQIRIEENDDDEFNPNGIECLMF